MEKITWGIIGCGDVTEVKSGPAFNKVSDSQLVAVMRRNAVKAEDYASRHGVPKFYTDANSLIDDPGVNAIYIATPPSSHEAYALAAFEAGKPVYLEKPMSLTADSARIINNAAISKGQKLCVAHYRRRQPLFLKIKELLAANTIGKVRSVNLKYCKRAITSEMMEKQGVAWRVDPNISGGGLFHDLAPHQLDLMLYFFGDVQNASGFASQKNELYNADDVVAGTILFTNGIVFSGAWNFVAEAKNEIDHCEILGTKGSMTFPIFDHQQIILNEDGKEMIIPFEKLQHVQQPLIASVVQYFLGKAANPSDGPNAVKVMELIDTFTGK